MEKKETFEEQYRELEDIVNKLQNDDLDIDVAIKEFKKGIELHKNCKTILENAQKEVEKILEDDQLLEQE